MFNQITAGGKDEVLLNPDFPSCNFDVIDMVSYKIDLSQSSKFDKDGAVINQGENRIVELSFDGKPIYPTADFMVTTNNRRAGGGNKFPGADGTTVMFEAPKAMAHVDQVQGAKIEDAGEGPDGFAQFRITW